MSSVEYMVRALGVPRMYLQGPVVLVAVDIQSLELYTGKCILYRYTQINRHLFKLISLEKRAILVVI